MARPRKYKIELTDGELESLKSTISKNKTSKTIVEPLGRTHHVSVREHHTAVDWAEEMKYLADVMYPDVGKIILVMDNLNTRKPSSLHKRYPVDEVRRIIKRWEIHYTPKHGSWPGIEEIEFNVMTR